MGRIIEPAASPWASNIVQLRKKDVSLRFSVDYKTERRHLPGSLSSSTNRQLSECRVRIRVRQAQNKVDQ